MKLNNMGNSIYWYETNNSLKIHASSQTQKNLKVVRQLIKVN